MNKDELTSMMSSYTFSFSFCFWKQSVSESTNDNKGDTYF